ncbi:MAG: GAF domain-containing protein [Aquificae bacterium]|nr:GAF domain-containing protein [Aquificota bacterium]
MSTLRLRELSVVNEITRVLTQGLPFRKTLSEVLKILYAYMGVEHSFVAFKDQNSVKIASSFGLPEPEGVAFGKGEGITGRVFSRGIPVVIPRVKESNLFANKTGIGKFLSPDAYALAVPVKVGSEIKGVLTVFKEFESEESVEKFLETLSIIGNTLGLFFKLSEKLEEERMRWEEEKRMLTMELRERYSLRGILGKSKAIKNLVELVQKIARTDSTVLILGESGTGKSLVAKAIHYESPRRDGPFITVNCAAIPESLLEAELFGYEKGAFTGAYSSKKGKFELADGGTLFLDEIGDLPLSLQAKLLRALQEKEIEPLGSEKTVKVDVRIVAATNKDLRKLVKEGKFREDLYYRLNVVELRVPPLRERREDVPLLIEYYLRQFNEKYQKRVRISPKAMKLLLEYHWPGNVRELANLVERLVILSDGEVGPEDLPEHVKKRDEAPRGELPKLIEETEKQKIIEALEKTGYVKSRAAKLLGYTLRQLDYRIKKYNIEVKRF